MSLYITVWIHAFSIIAPIVNIAIYFIIICLFILSNSGTPKLIYKIYIFLKSWQLTTDIRHLWVLTFIVQYYHKARRILNFLTVYIRSYFDYKIQKFHIRYLTNLLIEFKIKNCYLVFLFVDLSKLNTTIQRTFLKKLNDAKTCPSKRYYLKRKFSTFFFPQIYAYL